MSFPRYLDYKDSGVEWLREIPEHWRLVRIKHLVTHFEQGWSPQCEGYPAESDQEWGVLKVGCVNGGAFKPEENKALPVELEPVPALAVLANDLLISRANTKELVGSAAVVKADYPNLMLCDKLFRLRFHPSQCVAEFIGLYLGTSAVRRQIELSATGASSSMLNIDQSTILELPVGLPEVEEQILIVGHLNMESVCIDSLIAEQQRLIELLQEKRQAVISHAVTKGLDPDVPMKDSGVEWLGEVPEHWDIVRLGSLFTERNDRGGDDLPILSVSIHSGVSDKQFEEDELDRKVSRSEDRSKYKAVCPGDLVYNMMRAWQGGFGTVTVEGQVSPAYVTARPQREIKTEYVEQVLRSPLAIEEMRRHSRGITDFRLRLYWNEFKNIHIALPSTSEQVLILEVARRQTDRFDELIEEAAIAITLLQERRSALISAAVTGQIDVRGLAKLEAA